MNPKIEMDVKPKIEYIDDFNKGMEIIGNMNIPVKAEMQDKSLEKYKCFVCTSLEFSSRNHLIQHMDPTHTIYVEYLFKKNHKTCLNDPLSSGKRLSKLSISDKILHLIDCDLKIEPIKEISTDKEVIANMDIPVKAKTQVENSEKIYCVFKNCGKQIFPTQKLMIEHMNTEHSKYIKKMKECINCETSFHANSSITECMIISEKILHMIECFQKSELQTRIKIIAKIDILVKANALNENSEKHYCIICHKQKFNTLKSLIEHLQNDHKKSIKKKKECMECETSFHTKSIPERVLHMIECYQKNEGLTRSGCNPNKKKFKKKYPEKSPKKSQKKSQRIFSCVFCPELNFSTHQPLSKHTKFAHKGHKLKRKSNCCTCVHCIKKFSEKS